MTVPHDSRAPYRNQRWVECINAAGETIPAFSVAEVMSASNVNDQTILHLRKPTKSDLQNIVITGHLPMEDGKYGFCTNDLATYARYDSTCGTPEPGDEWGPAKASFKLRKGHTGFFILGDPLTDDDLSDGQAVVRVQRGAWFPKFATATLSAQLCGGSTAPNLSDEKPWTPQCDTVNMTNVSNPWSHRGKNGDDVLLMQNLCDAEPSVGACDTDARPFDVVAVIGREACVAVEIKNVDDACLAYATLKMRAEHCLDDEPDTMCKIIDLVDCSESAGTCTLTYSYAVTCCGQVG